MPAYPETAVVEIAQARDLDREFLQFGSAAPIFTRGIDQAGRRLGWRDEGPSKSVLVIW